MLLFSSSILLILAHKQSNMTKNHNNICGELHFACMFVYHVSLKVLDCQIVIIQGVDFCLDMIRYVGGFFLCLVVELIVIKRQAQCQRTE